jgi:hypothetical protein
MRSGESLYGSEINYDELMTFFWFFIIVILNTDYFINKSIMMLVSGLVSYTTEHIFCKVYTFFDEYLQMKFES